MNRSQVTIVAIFGISSLFGVFSVWYHFQQGRRCLEFWGSEAGNDIQHAPLVEGRPLFPISRDRVESAMLHSESDDSSSNDSDRPEEDLEEPLPIIQIDGNEYAMGESIDITHRAGILHARHALIMDSSFEWESSLPPQTLWSVVLVFSGRGDSSTAVAIDFNKNLIRLVSMPDSMSTPSSRIARLTPVAAEAIRKFLDRPDVPFQFRYP